MWQTLLASKSVLVSLIVSLLLVAGSLVYQESVKRNIPEQQARTQRLLQQIETNDTARTTSPSENTDMDTEGQTEAPIATDDTREMMAEEEDGCSCLISRASLSAHSKRQCPPCDAAFFISTVS